MGAFIVLSVVNLWRCNYVYKEIRNHERHRQRRDHPEDLCPGRKGAGHRLRGGDHQAGFYRRHRLRHHPGGRGRQQGRQFGAGVPRVGAGGQRDCTEG